MRDRKYRFNIVAGRNGLLALGRTYIILVLILLTSSCISPFFAEVDDEPVLISIEGSIIKGKPVQTVVISRSTTIGNPKFIQLRGCDVSVIDESDAHYSFTDNDDGSYTAEIPDEKLLVDKGYRLRVETPEGEIYESREERLISGVDIDTVYYNVESGIDAISGNEYAGIQFYIDIEAPDSISRYFRWKLEETFEYNSIGPISYFYFDKSYTPVPPDDIWGVYTCWKTEEIQGEYLSSTMNLTVNEKKRIPLNYVSDQTERLKVKYSLLVSQYTLNEDAYKYFQINKMALEEAGGLYTRQPRQPMTNMYNINDTTARVLGFFWLSSRSQKRMFILPIESINAQDIICAQEVYNLEDHGDGPFPLYLWDKGDALIVASPYCFDCRRRGGTTRRPVFWE